MKHIMTMHSLRARRAQKRRDDDLAVWWALREHALSLWEIGKATKMRALRVQRAVDRLLEREQIQDTWMGEPDLDMTARRVYYRVGRPFSRPTPTKPEGLSRP